MWNRIKQWWRGPERYKAAGIQIVGDVLYKPSAEILKSEEAQRQIRGFCELNRPS